MLTGVEILIWFVRETTNSCVDVGESSRKGHETVGKPLSDAEDQPLWDTVRATMIVRFEGAEATHLYTALEHTPRIVDIPSAHRNKRFTLNQLAYEKE